MRPRGWRCCSLRPTAAHCAGPCLLLLVRAAPWEVLILGEQAEEEVGDRVPLFLLCSWCFNAREGEVMASPCGQGQAGFYARAQAGHQIPVPCILYFASAWGALQPASELPTHAQILFACFPPESTAASCP